MKLVSAPPSIARRAGILLCWLLVGATAVAAQRWLLPWVRKSPAGPGEARWLWAVPASRPEIRPVAFFLVREFDLPSPPAAARLALLGDEEYSAFLNGKWVGSGHYVAGSGLEVWQVDGLLRSGRNRIVVELRSSLGLGGFLARLVSGAGDSLLVSDLGWRVLRADSPGLLEDGAIPPGEPPLDLGPSPAGRWGTPGLSAVRPALAGQEFPEWRAAASRALGAREWTPLPSSPSRYVPLGKAVTFDWGEEVGGYLALEFVGSEARPGLLAFEDEAPGSGRPVADELVVRIAGRSYWIDSRPRRFRFATVLSLDELVDAKVYTTAGATAASELRLFGRRGVLGVDPPPLRAPVEDEIWRELEGFAGQPVRESR